MRNPVMNIACAVAAITLSTASFAEIMDSTIPTHFVVRGIQGISDSAVAYLAAIAKPRVITIDANSDTSVLVESFCGDVTEAYKDAFEKANGLKIGPVMSRREVIFPACFHMKKNKTITVQWGDSLSTIASSHVGLSGPVTVGKIIAANPDTLVASNSTDKIIIKPGQNLNLPFSSELVEYQLKSDIGVDSKTAIGELRRRVSESAGPLGLKGGVIIPGDEELLLPQDLRPQSSGATCTGRERDWPFSVVKLRKILELNEKNGAIDAQHVVVAVIDSGIDGFDTKTFPASVFAIKKDEYLGRPDEDLDGNGFVHDFYGVNVHDRKALPVAEHDFHGGQHGTHVAGLVLGGPAFRDQQQLPKALTAIKLKIINLVVKEKIAGSNGAPITNYRSYPGGLSEAIGYAAAERVMIANVSYSVANRPAHMDEILSGTGSNLLIVASAGNQAKNLDRSSIYPASFGGTEGRQNTKVLTVAAHDGNFRLAPFSNIGSTRVDLAAPGCDVDSYGFAMTRMNYSGTSQAAPIVTFAAALLAAHGVITPKLLKSRLIASVDLHSEYDGFIASQGSLNIQKALHVYHDTVELRSNPGELLIGRVVASGSTFTLCGGEDGIPASALLKVAPDYPVKGRAHIVEADSERKATVRNCKFDPKQPELKFQEAGKDNPRLIPWDEIADLVFAYFSQSVSTESRN